MPTLPPSRPCKQVHPAVKLAGLLLFSIALSFVQTLPAAAVALAVALPMPFVMRLPARHVLRRMALGNVFVVFLWLTMPLAVGHTLLFQWGWVQVFNEGVTASLLLTLKINALLALGLAGLQTSTPHETAEGLAALHIPQKLILLLLLTARHMHSLTATYRNVQHAAALRGFTPALRPAKLKIFANLVTFVLLKSLHRADHVDAAMRLRGFSGAFPPPLFNAPQRSVWPGLVLCALAVALLVLVELAGRNILPLP